MNEQPEALRLADNLDTGGYAMRDLKQAAAELRRLHEANQERLETLRWLDRWMGEKPLLDCANKVRAAIAKETGETT